jgi:hypothetical protein
VQKRVVEVEMVQLCWLRHGPSIGIGTIAGTGVESSPRLRASAQEASSIFNPQKLLPTQE